VVGLNGGDIHHLTLLAHQHSGGAHAILCDLPTTLEKRHWSQLPIKLNTALLTIDNNHFFILCVFCVYC
jgi:hypothetical protein